MEIDYSLYPDLDPCEWPSEFTTLEDQADYIHRLCSAWDFYGFPPTAACVDGMRAWRQAFEQFPILHSPAYCALCELLGFPHDPPAPYPGRLRWEEDDELDGREYDDCLQML